MQQLHDMDTFFPRDPKTLTREEQIKALLSLIFLKQKHTGEVKSRTCINGAPQRAYIKKEDAASPTVATDSVFITGAIDAYEGRDVATCDLPGTFLHTITDEKVIMVLRNKLCDLMVAVNPKLYRKYVCKDKRGKPVLYAELFKSLYGLMRSVLLFYRKLKKELEEYGFELNPYDPCVANKTTKDGSQLTVSWHVNDLKISCKNGWEITKLLLHLKKIYGEKISIHQGKQFTYLGMQLDYSEPGTSLRRSRSPAHAHTIKTYFALEKRAKPSSSPRSKPLNSTTLWPNWSSCKNEQEETSRQRLHSFLLE